MAVDGLLPAQRVKLCSQSVAFLLGLGGPIRGLLRLGLVGLGDLVELRL